MHRAKKSSSMLLKRNIVIMTSNQTGHEHVKYKEIHTISIFSIP